jgi:hypothetical protein
MVKIALYCPVLCVLALLLLPSCNVGDVQKEAIPGTSLSLMDEDAHTRWASFENPGASKGAGAIANRGAKGHAFEGLDSGESKTLLDISGAGVITRFWCTLSSRNPHTLRLVRLDMYWDGSDTAAVSVPFGDFFCRIHGHRADGKNGGSFENELFSSPEGRSFNCIIPMPFRSGARVVVTNEGDDNISHIFYDIDCVRLDRLPEDMLYFHASWRREEATKLGEDFKILPRVNGKGRFLGCHVGVITHDENIGWWGEGEVKIYLDGDRSYPTLAGTGTEDYIGTGWGLGEYIHRYQGCTIADGDKGMYGFYRYHIPDPVWFHSDIEVTMQQIGGAGKAHVLDALQRGAPIEPISVDAGGGDKFVRLLDEFDGVTLDHESIPDGWTNFYRSDDWSAAAFFYLDRPVNGLPALPGPDVRISGILSAD